jgi:cellulose synthase/poly-beta-1,6-N-acetylglucosamine synthase-like glycosyltransferase
MLYVVGIVVSLYTLACLWLCSQWRGIPRRPVHQKILPTDFKLSVIIPVRNEAANIGVLLGDLEKQTLGKSQFEVIVVNDASTDKTEDIINTYISKKTIDLQLISLEDIPISSPKKRAITEALKRAQGRLIVTTDGDCRVGERWLETMAQAYLETGAKFISGPVTFLDAPTSFTERSWGRIFQTIEFSSLIGTGACLLEAGHPTMCNGANLAYERAAFDAVGGYAGVDQIASGDDEFLLQKIHQTFGERICFLKNKDAIVQTHPPENWRAFYQQRIRWASKWAVNKRVATMMVAVFVFLVNLFTLILTGMALNEGLTNFWINTILIIKFLPEFLFLSLIIRFLNKNKLVSYIPLVQLFYPFYVLFFGITAQRKGYEWKGRKLR